MNLTVIIPSKTISNLVPCVNAVRHHEPDARIIVVDDGLDLSVRGRSLESLDCNFEIVAGKKPFIFARNVNIGIRAAGDSDVVLLNDDALLETDRGFSKLAAFALDHPECGAVVPACNVTGQRLQWRTQATPDGYRLVDNAPYVCVYIPRRTLDRIGLLDERYCLDYGVEDADHCESMKRAGLKVGILYSVFVDHGSLTSSFRGNPHAPASFERNQALFDAKWAGV